MAVEPLDPRRLADAALAAALRPDVDAVYVEPVVDGYALVVARGVTTRTSAPMEPLLGRAVIARLAALSGIELVPDRVVRRPLDVRVGDRQMELLITIHTGGELRADLTRPRPPVPVVAADPEPGTWIGAYRVVERLLEGGMGTLFAVEHAGDGRRCAMKVLRARAIEHDPTAAHRFLREARCAARVRHPHIVEVFDFGYLADGRPYVVMELLAGETLAERVRRTGPLPAEAVIAIARQLADALAAAHERNVVHADVTPTNVLLVGELAVKLVDFGLCELAAGVTEHPERVLGTPAYISPEQLRGEAPTPRSDQYGLGAVLFELVTGHPPFQHAELRELCAMHLSAPVPPLASPHGPVPARLAAVVTTCLQKVPEARFPDLRALLVALDDHVPERRGAPRTSRPPLVVCVDDDEARLGTMLRALAREPAALRSTREARQALDWLAAERVAVLVTADPELAQQARAIRPDTVRVLVARARTAPASDDAELVRVSGKPFDSAQLREAVGVAVQRHAELVSGAAERARRAWLQGVCAAIDAAYPGLSEVPPAAAHEVPAPAPAALEALGLA